MIDASNKRKKPGRGIAALGLTYGLVLCGLLHCAIPAKAQVAVARETTNSAAATSRPQPASRRARDPEYECRWTDAPVIVDGVPREPAWRRAQIIKGFLVPPARGVAGPPRGHAKLAASLTVVRLLWDNEHLCFSAELDDGDVCGMHEGHDVPFGKDDVIELFVKPDGSQPGYWEFHVTPRGATRDYCHAKRHTGRDEQAMAHQSGMWAAVSLRGTVSRWVSPNESFLADWKDRDRGWTVEMAIPLSAFARTAPKPKPGDRWPFLIGRYDYSVHLKDGLELSAAALLPAANFHLHEHYGHLVFVRRPAPAAEPEPVVPLGRRRSDLGKCHPKATSQPSSRATRESSSWRAQRLWPM